MFSSFSTTALCCRMNSRRMKADPCPIASLSDPQVHERTRSSLLAQAVPRSGKSLSLCRDQVRRREVCRAHSSPSSLHHDGTKRLTSLVAFAPRSTGCKSTSISPYLLTSRSRSSPSRSGTPLATGHPPTRSSRRPTWARFRLTLL